MRTNRARLLALTGVAIAVMSVSSWPLAAQSTAKKPLTYDVYESWKSIGGARLSDDGKWFAYSVTSLAEDGELTVRNLQSGKEFKHARGTAPQITPDGKFVIFTIVPPRADADSNAQGGREGGGGAAAGGAAEGGAQGAQANRNSVGIMSLADGSVTTVEQISTFRLPAESSTWLAQIGRAHV